MESILQQGPVRPVREVSVPQAMRPAVDLIARLAVERARLRDDLQRLRDDVTSVEPPVKEPRSSQPASEVDALRAELGRVTAERDALRREVEQLRAVRSSDPFDGLLERLERVAGRLEGASASTSSSKARRRPASGRVSREEVATTRSASRAPAAASPAQGGGMLGSLVAQNLALRPRSDRAQRTGSTPSTTPRPEAPSKTPAPQARPANDGGGGFLAGLIKQNLAVRSTPHGQSRARAA